MNYATKLIITLLVGLLVGTVGLALGLEKIAPAIGAITSGGMYLTWGLWKLTE